MSTSRFATSSRLACTASYTAIDSVCVLPGMLPATMGVAPNCPAHASVAAPGRDAAPGQRQRDAPEHARLGNAEHARGVLQLRSTASKAARGLEHQRERHHRGRDHRAR